ncbi:MAG: hypothetical protein KME45_29240 [Stenomitos rutilans HA7619-LM2]|jgi:hypothetical protein|nr:hypothetical protein [Stenomitos rutilans HA7619-LM2]
MTPSEIEALLSAVFGQCEAALHPLNDCQKYILRQAIQAAVPFEVEVKQQEGDREVTTAFSTAASDSSNPLEQLSAEERQTFLAFVTLQERQNQPWKVTLLNDWLSGRSSGAVQFIRERYGLQWVEQITPWHLARYINLERDDLVRLKVGDHIEVTNGLWEWVQETGPCSREWFPCTVVNIKPNPHTPDSPLSETAVAVPEVEAPEVEVPEHKGTSCIIRFKDGTEYEIQGMYDWNRPNWRWLEGARSEE